MSEEIKEILDEIRDSYYETQPSTKFYKNVKTIEEHITKLQNKVEELMTLYTTERNVKEDYKNIIKEVREQIHKDREKNDYEKDGLMKQAFYCNKTNILLEILDKENKS